MSDLISRQQAITALAYAEETGTMKCGELSSVFKVLNILPSVQKEIVCCKDCKHYEYGICKKAGLCVNKSPNGFCDWGERREVTNGN